MTYFQVVPGQVIGSEHMNAAISQGIPPFASAAARDATIPAPYQGQEIYREDLYRRQIYMGGRWLDDWGQLAQPAYMGAARTAFAVHDQPMQTDAGGNTGAMDLSLGGQLAGGQIIWASPVLYEITETVTISITSGFVAAADFVLRHHSGALYANRTITNMRICYLVLQA